MIEHHLTSILLIPARCPQALFAADEDIFPSMHFLIRLTGAWLLVALYAGGIFVASSLSHPPMISAWELPHLDKLYHLIAYSGLTFVLIRALSVSCASRESDRSKAQRSAKS